MASETHWQNRNTTKDGTKLINPNKRSLGFDDIDEYAKKFKLSIERDAFMEGVRSGFHLASERFIEYLSEYEKRRTNSIIVIKNDESK